jgi:hypothetical protein
MATCSWGYIIPEPIEIDLAVGPIHLERLGKRENSEQRNSQSCDLLLPRKFTWSFHEHRSSTLQVRIGPLMQQPREQWSCVKKTHRWITPADYRGPINTDSHGSLSGTGQIRSGATREPLEGPGLSARDHWLGRLTFSSYPPSLGADQ